MLRPPQGQASASSPVSALTAWVPPLCSQLEIKLTLTPPSVISGAEPCPELRTHRSTCQPGSLTGALSSAGPKPNFCLLCLPPAPSLGFLISVGGRSSFQPEPSRSALILLYYTLHIQSVGESYLRDRSRLFPLLCTSSARGLGLNTVPSHRDYGTNRSRLPTPQSSLATATKVVVGFCLPFLELLHSLSQFIQGKPGGFARGPTNPMESGPGFFLHSHWPPGAYSHKLGWLGMAPQDIGICHPLFEGLCCGLNCVSPKALCLSSTPSTYERDPIRKQGLRRCDQG